MNDVLTLRQVLPLLCCESVKLIFRCRDDADLTICLSAEDLNETSLNRVISFFDGVKFLHFEDDCTILDSDPLDWIVSSIFPCSTVPGGLVAFCRYQPFRNPQSLQLIRERSGSDAGALQDLPEPQPAGSE